MKTFAVAILLLALSVSAFAAGDTKYYVPFSNISAASSAVKTSAALYVAGFKTKTMRVNGCTLASNNTTTVFQNMSGTHIAQCAPTSSGPWTTCISPSYAQTAASLTANGSFTWQDASPYVRFQWTASTTGHKIKSWLELLSD